MFGGPILTNFAAMCTLQSTIFPSIQRLYRHRPAPQIEASHSLPLKDCRPAVFHKSFIWFYLLRRGQIRVKGPKAPAARSCCLRD